MSIELSMDKEKPSPIHARQFSQLEKLTNTCTQPITAHLKNGRNELKMHLAMH